MTPEPRKPEVISVTVSVLCLLVLFSLDCYGQTPSPSPTPAPTTCSAPTACPKLAPRIIQITAIYKKGDQPLEPADKVTQLARKRFFLSSCPFNLDKLQNTLRAPSRTRYYAGIKASPQLIAWLEANNCDTVYCRELRREEVACMAQGTTQCVPEFTSAYQEALRKLKNEELARKLVTNYAPLSQPELRVGFHKEKMRWLEQVRSAAEKASGLPAGAIRSAMTDRRGMAYFYDLCPGTYYISSLAPIEIDGEQFVWETTAITIKAPKASEQDQLSVTPVFLANVASKKKRANFFIGKRVAQTASASSPRR